MNKIIKSKGSILIIAAGVFWGSMGLFVRHLDKYGFSSSQIASMRIITAAIIFSIILLFKDRKGFRINIKDIFLFLGLGLCSILFFTICYFTSINLMSMSAAAILLYTSPVWVMLMSAVFFREKISANKIAALIFAFAGCILVSGFGNVTLPGIITGICSGIGYGLYSILGTVALRKYSPFTVTTYTFIIAAVGSLFICSPVDMYDKISSAENTASLLLFILLTGLVTAVIPFLFYTIGLETTQASKAAILVTVEPMVATLLGFIVYQEPVTVLSTIGIIFILTAIIILNKKSKNR